MGAIQIIPIHVHDKDILYPLSKELHHQFGLPVLINVVEFDYSFAHDPYRNQYHSTKMLTAIKNLVKSPQDKMIGLVDFDLYIPILTFVYGEAQLNGSASIVSQARLKPDFYGLPKNNELELERLKKEAVHELGHTFGLRHCEDFECVMRASTYVEEIDFEIGQFLYKLPD